MSSYLQSPASNSNRFRSFMSTANTPQQQCIYSPQTLSGSETDVSTSNENLSTEDRYVIRHTARQEPQGQENLQLQVYSNRNSQRESSSSYNTLIIHSLGEDTWTGRNSGPKDSPDNCSLYNAALCQPSNSNISMGVYDSTSGATKRLSQGSNCSMGGRTSTGSVGNHPVQEINDIPDDYLNQSSVLKHLAKEATTKSPGYSTADHGDTPTLMLSTQQQHNRPSSATNTHRNVISKNCLSKSQPDLSRADTNTVITSESQQTTNTPLKTQQLQQLQQQQHYSAPVLMRNSSGGGGGGNAGVLYGARYRRDVSMPRPRTRGRDALDMMLTGNVEPFARDKGANETWSADMIDMLLKENSALKLEVENCYARIGKSQKLEQEVLKVHSAHEDLVASCERRERLERTARTKLQLECRRLQDTNRLLRDQLDIQQVQLLATATATGGASGTVGVQQSGAADEYNAEYVRREMTKRDLLIAQFITQNKELAATKERQEIELTAQRATLQEQRTHIDILEAALTNAQGNVVRLEDECRKKQAYVERVGQLQRALSAMQVANDRREQTERTLRLQLELELERTNNCGTDASHSGNVAVAGQQQHVGEDVRRQLREREEALMRLEGECATWEQRYLGESALRQAAIDAACIPKDAKIAALEKTGEETEKIIAEARTDKMRHMDKAHTAHKKLADLESRLKDVESKLAERDAMIRVLNQKHYSAHASTTDRHHHHHHMVALPSRDDLVSSVLTTSSTGFSSGNSYSGSESSSSLVGGYVAGAVGGGTFDATKKTLDSQIKEIDSQLDTQMLTKRALCCFPGFANPIAAARKGKLPKPLLAGLTPTAPTPAPITHKKQQQPDTTSDTATLYGSIDTSSSSSSSVQLLLPNTTTSANTVTDILLLEKQGRSSQLQRMSTDSNLPPSSLPRPPPRLYQQPPTTNKSPLRYNRLDTFLYNTRRKKPPTDDSTNAQLTPTTPTTTTVRSMIPSPSTVNRNRLEYTRLIDSSATGSTVSLRKTRARFTDRDSTLSDNSVPLASVGGGGGGGGAAAAKVRFYSGGHAAPTATTAVVAVGAGRRGSSLGRDGGKGNGAEAPNQYRIQF